VCPRVHGAVHSRVRRHDRGPVTAVELPAPSRFTRRLVHGSLFFDLQAPPNHPGYGKVMAIDTQALGELEVRDVTGATVRVGSAWAKGPAVLVFLRHFG